MPLMSHTENKCYITGNSERGMGSSVSRHDLRDMSLFEAHVGGSVVVSHHVIAASELGESWAFCCILAKSVIMIIASNIDRVSRWLLLNEMKLQWSILFVTHPQNRNDYGLLATKEMDIECLLSVGLELPPVKLLHWVNWIFYLFYLFCIKYCEICWFPHYISVYNTTEVRANAVPFSGLW